MAKQELKFRLEGVAPLLMHNGQLSDPLNQWARAMAKLNAKRQKTDADRIEISRLEWYGSIYLMDGGKPCIPGEVMEATLQQAAKKRKLGTQAKQAIFCPDNYALDFPDSGKPVDELWESDKYRMTCRAVVNGRSSIQRTRVRFDEWAATVSVIFEDTIIDPAQVVDMMNVAGDLIGLMDWRPRFGRFIATEVA